MAVQSVEVKPFKHHHASLAISGGLDFEVVGRGGDTSVTL